MSEYKFEFNFCDISYYSQNCNNTILYYDLLFVGIGYFLYQSLKATVN